MFDGGPLTVARIHNTKTMLLHMASSQLLDNEVTQWITDKLYISERLTSSMFSEGPQKYLSLWV